MHFTKLVPNIFYSDIRSGIKLFVSCLEFSIVHDEIESDHPFYVVEKEALRVNLFQNEEYANKEHPEFRLVTDNIEEVLLKIKSAYPELLHPNLNRITLRPWGAKEFAIVFKIAYGLLSSKNYSPIFLALCMPPTIVLRCCSTGLI